MWLKIPDKNVFFVSVSQFGMALSFGYVMTFMPFYITQISTFGPRETMIWIGLIMGPSYIITALAAPFWGGLTSRFSPKLLFERGMLCNGIVFLVMGFVNNLYLLLLLRIIQGFLGGVSTIGLILTSAKSQKERLHKDLSLFQNSMTAGQLIGPPLGAYAASVLGYRAAFVFAFVIVAFFLVFCHWNVSEIPLQKKKVLFGYPCQKKPFLGMGLNLYGYSPSHISSQHPPENPGRFSVNSICGVEIRRVHHHVLHSGRHFRKLSSHSPLLEDGAGEGHPDGLHSGLPPSGLADLRQRGSQFLVAPDGPGGLHRRYLSSDDLLLCSRCRGENDGHFELSKVCRDGGWTHYGNRCLCLL